MAFGAVLADVYRRCNLPVAPATADATRIKAFVNETHRELLTSPGLDRLRDDKTTFASVIGQSVYAPGQAIAKIKDIYDATTNYWRLRELSLDDLRTLDPGLTASGNPEYWIPLGYQPVMTQPAAATGVWAVSSSASDTAQVVHLEGARTGNYPTVDQTATLTGTSRVQVGALTDLIAIDKFSLSAVAVGTVSLFSAALAGTELARIPIGFTQARNFVIQLYPIPAATLTYSLDYTREILDLAQDSDEPSLPQDFHDLLGKGARVKEYEFRADTRLSVAQQEYVKRRSDLFQWVQNPPDYKPVPGGPKMRRSNLGGFYPSGTW